MNKARFATAAKHEIRLPSGAARIAVWQTSHRSDARFDGKHHQ